MESPATSFLPCLCLDSENNDRTRIQGGMKYSSFLFLTSGCHFPSEWVCMVCRAEGGGDGEELA